MNEVYLEIYSLTDLCVAPVETVVTLFTIRYCNSDMAIKLIKSEPKMDEQAYTVDTSHFTYEVVDLDGIPNYAASCQLPSIILNKTSCIAGLCAILRQIIKDTVAKRPVHYCRSLLGFKGSCLLACSEVSVWTKFCEVDLIATLKSLRKDETIETELPSSMARFECHMSQPVRIHNLYKYVTVKKVSNGNEVQESKKCLPEHVYAEGSYITLADIIIFVCVHILLTIFSSDTIFELVPLTMKWYERMLQNRTIVECLNCLPLEKRWKSDVINYTLPVVLNQSLYKSDTKRYKPRSRVYTRQEDIEYSLKLIKKSGINVDLDAEPYGVEVDFDWGDIPLDATPEGGSLPLTRMKRKYEQLENLCKPVIKLAKPGNVIVDFCSGSGHLGILIAYLLPNCTVILLENKEESLNRAKERVASLNLVNVKFYQCNLDYFKGNFDIGMSLHACGVATDLVIQQCIRRNAVFISCPCCYGSLCNCHHLTYPRSNVFKERLHNIEYIILSHAADQTHDEENVKTPQGYKCMAIIDSDRKLQAEQCGYKVYLGKLIPETCTPKNHLLVGIPGETTK